MTEETSSAPQGDPGPAPNDAGPSAGDEGTPIVVADPTHPQSRAFVEIAGAVDAQVRERAAGIVSH